jgi:hypothetical protein
MTLPIVAPDQVFADNVRAMGDTAIINQAALRNYALRVWFRGRTDAIPGVPDWDGDPNAIDELGNTFDRDQLGADYAQGLAESITVGQTAACKVQSDYLAMMERAMRLRHMGPARARMLAATRLLGHANMAGPLRRVQTMVEDMIQAGS